MPMIEHTPPCLQKSPVTTTYQDAFHMAKDFPELYARALEATKAGPATNNNNVSDWGDSLKS